MKELDVLLLRYVDERYSQAPEELKAAFRELLEAPDPLIYAYCLGGETPPDELLSLLIGRITNATPAS
jgi:antitoxin CptB